MVKPSFLVVLFTLLTLGLLTCAKSYTPFIVGGKTARVGAWPWMASIQVNNNHLCGGALIKPSTVLTSASCGIRLSPLNTVVVLGLHDQEDGKIGKPETIKIESVTTHPDWTYPQGYADLAIIKLAFQASNSSYVKPIALPGEDYDLTDKVCTMTGWGITGEEGLGSELQQKELRVWSDIECRKWWQQIDIRRICARDSDGTEYAGVCELDTGGPLSCPVKDGYVLGGINSYFWKACTGSGPAVFNNIPVFLDWINANSV